MVSERQACAVLKEVFERAGYTIAENVLFSEGGVSFTADGWDAAARVGYEFISREADDRGDLSAMEVTELGRRLIDGEVFFFIVEQSQVASTTDLEWSAAAFLDEIARRRTQP